MKKKPSAYEQLSHTDKVFLENVRKELEAVGKAVSQESLASVLICERELMLADDFQNSSGKLQRQLHNLTAPGNSAAIRLKRAMIKEVFGNG